VMPGWKFHELQGVPSSLERLDELMAGDSDYTVTFTTQQDEWFRYFCDHCGTSFCLLCGEGAVATAPTAPPKARVATAPAAPLLARASPSKGRASGGSHAPGTIGGALLEVLSSNLKELPVGTRYGLGSITEKTNLSAEAKKNTAGPILDESVYLENWTPEKDFSFKIMVWDRSKGPNLIGVCALDCSRLSLSNPVDLKDGSPATFDKFLKQNPEFAGCLEECGHYDVYKEAWGNNPTDLVMQLREHGIDIEWQQDSQEKVVTFQPGPTGITPNNLEDAVVEVVAEGSQAQRKGVMPGLKFHKLQGVPYSKEWLNELMLGNSNYTVTFIQDAFFDGFEGELDVVFPEGSGKVIGQLRVRVTAMEGPPPSSAIRRVPVP